MYVGVILLYINLQEKEEKWDKTRDGRINARNFPCSVYIENFMYI
jgi:hypothetical protein